MLRSLFGEKAVVEQPAVEYAPAPRAEVNFASLDQLIQQAADEDLVALWATTINDLEQGLNTVVTKTAPGSVNRVRNQVVALVNAVLHDADLQKALNSKARKSAIKKVIGVLRAALLS